MNELLAQFLSEARDALEGIGGKLMELERAVAHLDDKAAICAELSRLTGHKLVAQSDTSPDVDVGDQRLAPRH